MKVPAKKLKLVPVTIAETCPPVADKLVLQVTPIAAPCEESSFMKISLLVVTAVVFTVHVALVEFVAHETRPAEAEPQEDTEGLAAVPAAAQFVAVVRVAADKTPVAVTDVAEATPSEGVVIAQEVVRQKFPLPLVLPAASAGVVTAKDGLPAAFPCRTVTVVPRFAKADRGRAVALERLIADGVPRLGVISAQFVTRHTFPVPLLPTELGTPVPVVLKRNPVANPARFVPLRPTTVTAFEPLVVASTLNSAAVIADALPRTSPVSVLPVPVPPLAIEIGVVRVLHVAQPMAPAALIVMGDVPLNPALPTALMGSWPVTSAARFTAELVTVCVEPAKWARPTPGAVATTQVEQVKVPVVVIVPPPSGAVVAMLVTVPEAGVWHVPSAPRYCVPVQPVNKAMTPAETAGTIWPLLFVAVTPADAGTAAPLTWATPGFG
jgi:hypothetical protein